MNEITNTNIDAILNTLREADEEREDAENNAELLIQSNIFGIEIETRTDRDVWNNFDLGDILDPRSRREFKEAMFKEYVTSVFENTGEDDAGVVQYVNKHYARHLKTYLESISAEEVDNLGKRRVKSTDEHIEAQLGDLADRAKQVMKGNGLNSKTYYTTAFKGFLKRSLE